MTIGRRLAHAEGGPGLPSGRTPHATRRQQHYRVSVQSPAAPKGSSSPTYRTQRWRAACVVAALPLSACLSTIDGAPQERLLEPLAQAKAATLCAGQTPVGATPWQSDRKGVVQVDIDTSACGLSGDALYFTSLGGHGQQWVSRGASSIQRPTPSGFRLLVVHPQAEQ